METKHRTIIQAAVLLIVLVFAISGNMPERDTKATAHVSAYE